MAEIQESGGGGKGDKVRVQKKSGKPDMTPMVDLGFLLITFFIYTTTFSKPNTFKLSMPDKEDDPNKVEEQQEIKVSNTITVIMGKDDKIFWHQAPAGKVAITDLTETNYSADGIRKDILTKKANAIDREKFTVIIKPTDDANWKNTVDILDEMAITGQEIYAVTELTPSELEAYKQKTGQ